MPIAERIIMNTMKQATPTEILATLLFLPAYINNQLDIDKLSRRATDNNSQLDISDGF
jgi:hypothetical protein